MEIVISIFQSENRELKDRLVYMETQSRRDNLLFCEFIEDQGETNSDCERKVKCLFRRMGVNESILIARCHRKGYSVPYKIRPIIVTFEFFEERQ